MTSMLSLQARLSYEERRRAYLQQNTIPPKPVTAADAVSAHPPVISPVAAHQKPLYMGASQQVTDAPVPSEAGETRPPQDRGREKPARTQKGRGARQRKGKKTKKPRRSREITTMEKIADSAAGASSQQGHSPLQAAPFFAQPDFDGSQRVPPADDDLEQLYLKRDETSRRKYNFDGTERIDFREGVAVPKGITLARHSKTWDATKANTTLLEEGEYNYTPMDLGKPSRRFIPGDLARQLASSIVIRDEARFIAPKDWAVMQSGKEMARKEPTVLIASPEPEAAAFLTQGKEEEEAVPDNPERPWEGNRGTYKQRGDVPAVKALTAKPFFNPTSYIARQQTRLLEEAQRRVDLVAAGENPNVVNQVKFRVREPPTFVLKPKAQQLWHPAAAKTMLDEMIKVENIKLRALDALLEDVGPNGQRANMMDERLASLRSSIKGVRNRITHHRQAKNLAAKQSWGREDLKQLKIGGSNGLSLDVYLSIVGDMHMEDQVAFADDVP